MSRGRPRKYSESQLTLVDVLWLRGLSAAEIAEAVSATGRPMTRDAVKNQIDPLLRDREAMPAEAKAWFMTKLKRMHREAGGILPDRIFEP